MGNILILTPQVPYPPRQGTALRNWGILRGLAEHHAISLLSFVSEDQASTPDAVLEAQTERIALIPQPARAITDRLRDLLFTQRPDLIQRLASPVFAQQLQEWTTRHTFDWLLIEGLEMAPYLEVVPRPHRPAVIFDDHNCEYLLQQRAARADFGGESAKVGDDASLGSRAMRWVRALYSSIQWRRLRSYEAQVCRAADIVVAVSHADAEALRAIAPDVDPLVIPNGIDVASYAGFEETVPLSQPAFVFTGTMDFRPNVDGVLWFVRHVWPNIRAALPGAHFYVVGRNPHPRLDVLREIAGVEVTGSVPDTRPYIRAAMVYVVPLLVGGGTRLKLLESTAMGKPIVATPLAAEGFTDPDRAMLLADGPEDFADVCISLAKSSEARARHSARARAYADAYDWDVLLPSLLSRLGR